MMMVFMVGRGGGERVWHFNCIQRMRNLSIVVYVMRHIYEDGGDLNLLHSILLHTISYISKE
ncbi:hypothetical protein Tsubulata_029726 [Turnera subulata]|uniref:Uncharacterized protein n=1 Tax=Turnera subulata TaxID=218843 RepID=A0A9Q0G702_9ROSI|nr:hypothetical protein Tsubulata_029726 [Turnera subulata]